MRRAVAVDQSEAWATYQEFRSSGVTECGRNAVSIKGPYYNSSAFDAATIEANRIRRLLQTPEFRPH
jgi:hypothetical protein